MQQDGFQVQTNSTPAPASQMVEPGTVYNQNPAANQVKPKGTADPGILRAAAEWPDANPDPDLDPDYVKRLMACGPRRR